ncbi:DUF4760 domain-containing protein [Umezawaea tangerina]|uniref:DUF4760 domain-containing protein n=1 Tax=Umezawaea tangerina TaxID=84725 RepID=A0A2T0TH24_9PSEU|nr:hypothetical protein [Umezawaea tangerina]PRY44915.1 hypothetical protein CLV43_102480 [Umezawaea tangerina]
MGAGNLTTILNLIAVSISVGSLLATVLLTLSQVRTLRAANNSTAVVDMMLKHLSDTGYQDSEHYVVHQLNSRDSPEVGTFLLPPESRRHVIAVCEFFESLGFLILIKAVDDTAVTAFYNYRTRRAWVALRPYIEAERKIRGERTYMQCFEHAVELARRTPCPRALKELKIATLPPHVNTPAHLGVSTAAHPPSGSVDPLRMSGTAHP